MRIIVLQHVAFEGPGVIGEWAAGGGRPLRVLRLDQSPSFPEVGDFDALVVMGGPMGVGDEVAFPWLREEKALVAAAVDAGRRVLGICLGAQILASALGSRVFANVHKEIGWHAVDWTKESRALDLFAHMPARDTVFQWHGDTFDPPKGAVILGSSEACKCQGFAAGDGRVVGLQFHLEAREADVGALVDAGRDELSADGRYVQSAEEILSGAQEHCARLAPRMSVLLDRLLAQIERILDINGLGEVTKGAVEAARESLVISEA